MRRWIAAAGLAVLAVGVSACGGSSTPGPYDVRAKDVCLNQSDVESMSLEGIVVDEVQARGPSQVLVSGTATYVPTGGDVFWQCIVNVGERVQIDSFVSKLT